MYWDQFPHKIILKERKRERGGEREGAETREAMGEGGRSRRAF